MVRRRMRATSPNGMDLHDERTDLDELGINRKLIIGAFHRRIVGHDRSKGSQEQDAEEGMRATSPNGTDLHDEQTDSGE
jgi:hypothetical protein